MPDNYNLRIKACFGLGFEKIQSVHLGKLRQQVHEAAGHSVSVVRKQKEMTAGSTLTFSFFIQSGSPAHGMVPPSPCSGWFFPLVNLSGNALIVAKVCL